MTEPKQPSSSLIESLKPNIDLLIKHLDKSLTFHEVPERTGSFLIYELGDLAEKSNVWIKDETASDLFAILALTVAASAEDITKTAIIEYEVLPNPTQTRIVII